MQCKGKSFIVICLFAILSIIMGYAEDKIALNTTPEASQCLIIKDMQSNILYQEGDVVHRVSPCSTFKIALSLMGFDSKILQNETAPQWPYNEKYQAPIESWKVSHNPSLWMKNSCIWYSKVLNEKLGFERYKNYLKLLHYGNEDISGEGNGDDWIHCHLSSSLKISCLEQILLLEKLLKNQLPFSVYAQEITKKILFVEQLQNGWKFFGKAGSGFLDNCQMGWFVGWIEKQGNFFLVVVLIQDDDKKQDLPAGIRAKKRAKEILFTRRFIS